MRPTIAPTARRSVRVKRPGVDRFGGDKFPRLGLLGFYNGSVDTIGLSVSDYDDVDPLLRDIFFDAGPTLRDTADILTDAFASPLLNTDTMIGNESTGKLLLYAYGTDPSVLSKAYAYAKVDQIESFRFNVVSTQTIAGQVSTPTGETATAVWGDGTTTDYSGTDQDYSKDYGSAGNRTAVFVGNLTKYTMPQSGANVQFSLADLPSGLTDFACYGSNTVSGSLADLPSGLTYFACFGNNTVSGSLADLPSGLTYFACSGSNTVSGSLADLPSGLTYFLCDGSNTVSGSLADLPSGLTDFRCYGSNTVSGSLADLPSGLTYFRCYGSNTVADYTTRSWPNNMALVVLVPVSPGGLSSTEIDQLLVDLAAAGGTWASPKEITLTGTNAPRTSASDAAVTTLVSTKGVAVTVNT